YHSTTLGKCSAYEETSVHYRSGYYKVGLKCTQQNGTKLYCPNTCNASSPDIIGNYAPCKGKIECPNGGDGLCECGGKKYCDGDETCSASQDYDSTPLGKCSAYEETSVLYRSGYYKVGLKCTQQNGTKLYCPNKCNASSPDILGNDAPCKGKIECSGSLFATGETCTCGGKTYGSTCAATCNYEETPTSCSSKGKTFNQKCIDSSQNKFGECI
ncbi:MAG: hypothetical protein PHE89_08170, partial [Alphaproteobacteria bacterium]|nr:hypothetical protein [Alphaproteobacteria bacterium]